eukprot:TRINITY_DN25736_c0_g1_i1.p1 TRINITY_DN25736_c0_g1~~TRINITY_DN25736_c0_g1_i1.p1  ORF type:complete len:111 (-),score=5.89 TRINITY_DN25736_c0_g1_i1:172-504(-)
MQFCSECNNMLYPLEDRPNKRLLMACKSCQHREPALSFRVYQNYVLHQPEEKTQVVHDVATDPTLPRTRARCPKCMDIVEAVYFQSTSTRQEEAMSLYFVCCRCGHKWRE